MAAVFVTTAVFDVVYVLTASRRNSEPGGCLFGDGRNYCLMARGQVAAAPFSRRVLAPDLVRITTFGSQSARFAVLDALGVCAVVVSVIYLARHLGRARKLPTRMWLGAGLIAASLYILSPYGVRDIRYAPTLVDDPALGLGVAALTVMVAAPRRVALVVAPLLVASTVLTRESWALPLLGAALVFTRPWRRVAPARWLGLLMGLAATIGTGIGLSRPFSGHSVSPVTVAAQRLAYYGHLHGLLDLGYQATLAVGALPLIVIAHLLVGRQRHHQPRPTAAAALLAAAIIHLVQGALEGTDIGRIAYPSLPILAVVATIELAAATSSPLRRFDGLALWATVLMFHPWMTLSGSEDAYGQHLYYFGGAQTFQIAAEGLVVVVGVGAVMISRRRWLLARRVWPPDGQARWPHRDRVERR